MLALVTLVGIASHQRLPEAGSRFLPNLLPWFAAWLLIAPHLGVFDLNLVRELRQLWRPFWAMVLAAPMGGLLRAIWLGTTVIPLFVLIMGGISALALLTWRAIYTKVELNT